MRTALRLTAMGAALLILPAAGGAQEHQLTVRALVQPAEATVRMADVFVDPAGAGRSPGAPFPRQQEIFGDRPALVPLWELRGALSCESVSAPVLVGRRLRYIPAGIPAAQRQVLQAVLRALDRGGERRIELELGRIPAGAAEYLQRAASGTTAESTSDGGASPGGKLRAEPASHADSGGQPAGNGGGRRRRRFVLRAEDRILGVCTVSVLPFRTAAVAPHRLEPGEVIELGGMPRVSKPAEETAGTARRFPLAGRYRLTERLQAGEVLSSAVLERQPAVEAAAEVAVTMRRGVMELRVGGRALERGAVGETVDVRLSTGARVTAKVTAPGRLEVSGGWEAERGSRR